jgi:hypothetical protein
LNFLYTNFDIAFLYWVANIDWPSTVWFIPMDAMGADSRMIIALIVPTLLIIFTFILGFERIRSILDGKFYIFIMILGSLLTVLSVLATTIYQRSVFLKNNLKNLLIIE